MNTQASWKKGLCEVPSVERRRECVGAGPRRSPKLEWYCRIVTWSLDAAAALGGVSLVG